MNKQYTTEELEAIRQAAPELLEALKAAYSVLMDCIPDSECDMYKRNARHAAYAAIAKATGNTP